MERNPTLDQAFSIMGENFIGPFELNNINEKMGCKNFVDTFPLIDFSKEELIKSKETHLLILGNPFDLKGNPLNLMTLRDSLGINSQNSLPCFYNQDWYLAEPFMYESNINLKWYLIRKNVLSETRGKDPEMFMKNQRSFPSALLCAYVFFAQFLYNKEILWENDFVWCNDLDSNGDQIYVGRYKDILGLSKDGFSIHRHLRIRDNYGAL